MPSRRKTARDLPIVVNRLVYHETYNRIDDAIVREKEIKGWRRSKKNALVETLNPRWADLSGELFGRL
jgi:putative endonuclease